MYYKLKQSSGPMEVWGTDQERPINLTDKKLFEDDLYVISLEQWHSSFKFICTVKPEHEEKFRELAMKDYTGSTFIYDLSEGILIPSELVGFEDETIATNLVGGTGTIKHAILIEPKEEWEDELWEELIDMVNDDKSIRQIKEKFTIKRK